jgi:crotonobetainyl-CoA:carnitine CoA-transferase CaiB-like acyl-CoA transferase
MGHGQPHNAPAAEIVTTRDGHIVLSAYAEEHWQRFCRIVGREALAADPRFATNDLRVKHRAALREVLQDCLSSYTSEECVELLGRNQIVVGAVRRYHEVLRSPDVAQTGILVEAASADGAGYRALGLPYRLGDAPRPAPHAAPACGADTSKVLAEAGYSEQEIAALHGSGVIA